MKNIGAENVLYIL